MNRSSILTGLIIGGLVPAPKLYRRTADQQQPPSYAAPAASEVCRLMDAGVDPEIATSRAGQASTDDQMQKMFRDAADDGGEVVGLRLFRQVEQQCPQHLDAMVEAFDY